MKVKLSAYLKQLDQFKQEGGVDGCAQCLQLLNDMRSEGISLQANTCNTAMRACTCNLEAVEDLFDTLAANGLETEASYAALMQARLEHGEVLGAVDALKALLASGKHRPKLRTCGPLLRHLCDAGDRENVLDLWSKLEQRGVDFSAREYDARMRMHGRIGDARGLEDTLDASLAVNPTPDTDSIEALKAATRDCADASPVELGNGAPQARGTLAPTLQTATVDEAGKCNCCASTLRLLRLTVEEREQVRDVLLSRAASRSAAGLTHLNEYREWLRVRPPFDYVIDGPNVAYYGQNFEAGRFQFAQIQAVIDVLRRETPDARLLVLLPTKYLQREIPNHTCSSVRSNVVDEADRALIDSWAAEGLLYEVTNALYDDWYWMYATVAETRAPEEDVRTRAVTNDAMRDHWVELLPTLAFARWRASQIAGFTFHEQQPAAEAHDDGGGAARYEPSVAPLPLISVEAQREGTRRHIPIPTRGEDCDAAATAAPQHQQWLCVDFPRSEE